MSKIINDDSRFLALFIIMITLIIFYVTSDFSHFGETEKLEPLSSGLDSVENALDATDPQFKK